MLLEKRIGLNENGVLMARSVVKRHNSKHNQRLKVDASYRENWRQTQDARRSRNRQRRAAALSYYFHEYRINNLGSQYDAAETPPNDGESDDDNLYDIYFGIEGDSSSLDINGVKDLRNDRTSEPYMCIPCHTDSAAKCDFRTKRT
jgi:hypothetical protein